MGYSSYGYDDRTDTKSTNASCKHYGSFPTRNGPVYWWSCEMSRRAPGVFGRATEPNQALEPTPYSLRSAAAFGRGSAPAFGCYLTPSPAVIVVERKHKGSIDTHHKESYGNDLLAVADHTCVPEWNLTERAKHAGHKPVVRQRAGAKIGRA